MSEVAYAIADARPRVVAALAVHCRDLDLAEDAFADAAAKCLEQVDPPRSIAAWLMTTAKRKVVDAIRRQRAEARAIEGAAQTTEMADILTLPEPIADERLRLIFICCHPALAIEARVALALKVICGLPVAEIARLFLTSEQTMFQRITRAKRKVRDAGIAFELPARKAWAERLDAVLLTLELAYTAAYQDAAGERDGELSGEVARLAMMVAELLPKEPEALGLAALVLLANARENARVDDDGVMVPLSQQDATAWDVEAIEQARLWLDLAAQEQRTGPYQVMAAIQLTHVRRAFDGQTDYGVITTLYDALFAMRPGPMVVINRAMALSKVQGAERGLEELNAVDAEQLKNARPYYAARAELLTQAGRSAEAASALDMAIKLDPPRAERLFLERKRSALLEQD